MRLQSIEQKTTNKYVSQLGTLLLAAALAAGALGWFMSVFAVSLGRGGILGGGLKGGMIRTWNAVADALGSSDYVILSKYGGAGQGSGLFLMLTGVMLVLLGYAILRSKNIWLLLIYLVPVFGVQFLWEVKPSVASGMLFVCAVTCAAAYCLYPGRGKGTAILVLVFMLAICTAGGYFLAGGHYQKAELAQNADGAITAKIENLRYGSNPRGDGSLRPGAFGASQTALRVKMENPDSLYLRGFVGSSYAGGKWETLANSDYYGQRGLFYWLHRDGFSGLTQLYADSRLLGEERKAGSVTVTNENACRKYIYTPYELAGTGLADTKSWSDSFLTSDRFMGAKAYRFTAVSNMVRDWPGLTAKLFVGKKNEALEQYRLNESYYNVRIYEDYTQLSTDQKRLLVRYIGSAGNQEKGHVDYKTAIKKIRDYLESAFIYTENIRWDKDPVKKFLKEKKGSDIQFASAATLMFRYYGIPARYVEGYIITPEDVKGKKPEEPVSIPLSNNHAWTEIYIDSFGWVPIEATPEYYRRMEQPDFSKGLENQGAAHVFENKQQYKKDLKETSPSDKDKEPRLPWKLLLFLLAGDLILVALLYLLARLWRWIRRTRRRNKAFRNPDVKQAICAIYEYMMRSYVTLGEEARRIGDRAAFSPYCPEEPERRFMLEELERMKKEKNNEKKQNHCRCHGNTSAAGRRGLRRKGRRT